MRQGPGTGPVLHGDGRVEHLDVDPAAREGEHTGSGSFAHGRARLEGDHGRDRLGEMIEVMTGTEADDEDATAEVASELDAIDELSQLEVRNEELVRQLADIDSAKTSLEALVQELRLISKKGGSFDYIVGLFYQDQDRYIDVIASARPTAIAASSACAIGAPVALLSTSPERDDTIMMRDPFAG